MAGSITLIRNPLTIVGIFSGIVEISGAVVLPKLDAQLQSLFIWFLMLFPGLLVVLFFATLNWNQKVLYAPSDFADEANFMRALENGLTRSEKFRKLEEDAQSVRREIDKHPLFAFANLPPDAQWLLKKLHVDGKVKISDAEHAAIEEKGISPTIGLLKDKHRWIVVSGDEITFSDRGRQEVGSFIEITIPRYM